MLPRPLLRRVLTHVPAAVVIALVITAYAFFITHGTWTFETITWDQGFFKPGEGYYASLAEGFRRGQLSMAHEADPRLAGLPSPYDHGARHAAGIGYLWDASYFEGRYYLYFTPLPALLIHLPFSLVTGRYPHDTTVGLVFAAWAFLASAAFVRRALAGRRPHLPLWLWLLTLGLGTLIPVVIVYCRIYEIAILCGAAMSATFAWALLRFVEAPTNGRLVHASLWLALSIAARPNLAILVVILAAAIWIARRTDLLKAIAYAIAPLAVTAAAMAAYNVARFHDPFELGVKYQLTYMDMARYRVCSLCDGREALRLVNTAGIYLGAPLRFTGDFPFVSLTIQNLDQPISFSEYTDLVGGMGVVLPLAFVGSVFAAILALRRQPNDGATRGALFAVAAGWLALSGLSTCWYASARYELDFLLLISAGAVVCIEAALAWLSENGLRVTPLRAAFAALAAYSIVAGLLLGFTGAESAFPRANPELFQRLQELFQ